MGYDLNKLEQGEKDQLLQELISKYENEVSTSRLSDAEAPGTAGTLDDGMHPDAAQDAAMLESFAKVLEILINKVEELEERLCQNEKLVVEDLFGGIDKLYKGNLKAKGIEGLKGKYADRFAPYQDALSELAPGEDVYDHLYDMLDSLKGQEGWDESKEDETVGSVAQAIAEKVAKIKGEPVAVQVEKTETEPVAVATPDEPKEEEGGADKKLMDKVRQMKARNKSMGF